MNQGAKDQVAINYHSKTLDHLGLVAAMCEELEIAKKVDEAIPNQSPDKRVSYGQAVVAMILNGLGFINKALYLVPQFFEDKPLERLIGPGITAEYLNDDTLGRTLDALYAYGVTPLFSEISRQSVKMLGLSPKAGYMDSTSFHTDGQYHHDHPPNEDEKVIHITKGYSRDHRPDLNQVTLNLICESEGAIPVFMQAASGNSSDKTAFREMVNEHVSSLQNHLGVEYIIADSALYNEETLQSMGKQKLFITRVPETLNVAKALIAQMDPDRMIPIDEDYSYQLVGSIYGHLPQRWLVIHSQQAVNRESKTLKKTLLRKTEKELQRFNQLKKREFACEEDALKAFKQLEATLEITKVLEVKVAPFNKYDKPGKPAWDATPKKIIYRIQGTGASSIEKVKAEENKLGFFILATNELDEQKLPVAQVLRSYKGLSKVERGFKFLKSPYFLVASFFLKKPQRIEALLMVMTLCLLVYAALEFRIRQQLKKTNQHFPNQVGKPVQNPTARWIFESFMGIHLLIIEQIQEMVLNLQQKHLFILQLLGKPYERVYS